MLGEDRNRDRLDQFGGSIGEAIDVARDCHAALARHLRRSDGRRLIDIVHVHDARRSDRLDRQVAVAHRQLLVTVPQHDAIAVALVDEDDRELVLRVADDHIAHVDAALLQLLAHTPSVLVGAGHADVFCAQPEARAGAHRRGHLPAAEDLLAIDFHLGERAEGLRISGKEVDKIDGIGSDADDIPHRAGV